jgi:hypothetical protein
MERKHTVLLVDDHPIVRQGLALLINREPDLTVCGDAEDARIAMQAHIKDKLSLKNARELVQPAIQWNVCEKP